MMKSNLSEVIHYGHKKFLSYKFKPIKNSFIKPNGGLWASPVDSKYGWKDLCKDEDFIKCHKSNSFTFKFVEDARIYIVDSYTDLDTMLLYKLEEKYRKLNVSTPINYEGMRKEYDIIWLTFKGEQQTRNMSNPKSMYSWDCESILVLNKEVIVSL